MSDADVAQYSAEVNNGEDSAKPERIKVTIVGYYVPDRTAYHVDPRTGEELTDTVKVNLSIEDMCALEKGYLKDGDLGLYELVDALEVDLENDVTFEEAK
jgi:hypothetical protein